MNNEQDKPNRERPAAPTARPARPSAPAPRVPTAISPPFTPERPAIPQGLSLADPGLSGMPALRPAVDPAQLRAEMRREKSRQLRQTALPSCFVLGVTLPLLACCWFALDRFSVVRDNPLGLAIPALLAAIGLLFLAATALLMMKPSSPPAEIN